MNRIDRSTTVDRVVAALREAMFAGELNPGDTLREIALAEQFDVARSTMREAFRVLSAAGLVSRAPHRGVTVRRLSAEEVEDIFAARRVLEGQAAQALKTCPDAAIRKLEAAMRLYAEAAEKNDTLLGADAHVEFHAALVDLIGSARLTETERSIMRDLQLVIATIDKSSDDLPVEVGKHWVLCRLIAGRRTAEATEYIESELDHAKEFVLRACPPSASPME